MDREAGPRILLCAAEPESAACLRDILAQAGEPVCVDPAGAADPGELASYQAIVLQDSAHDGPALDFFRRLRPRLEEHFIPTLFVGPRAEPDARRAGFEAGADAVLASPVEPDRLLSQVKALLRIKQRHDRLAEKAAEMHHLNKRLQRVHERVQDELDLARRIQMSFLPQTLPQLPGVRFAVHYRPCAPVGGDFYDVFRLDEDHVGFYVADAVGHGVPACLLTIFLKKAVRAKEISGRDYRLLPPDEVLYRLNQELLHQQLAETPFITMVYGLLNFRQRTLQFARAGHPHPVYVPREGKVETWSLGGTLLGIFETSFPVRHESLHPGDKVLLTTDGTEGGAPITSLAARHRDHPLGEFIAHVARDLESGREVRDDLTLLGLEITEG